MDNFDDKTPGSSRSQEQSVLKRETPADEFENKTPVPPGPAALQDQIDALRHLVVSILILVVVIGGTFFIALLRQWRTVNKELAGFRPQAIRMISDYQKVSAPVMSDFLKKITEYGRTHPDFTPVLAKYGLKPGGSTAAAPASAATPPPAAPKP